VARKCGDSADTTAAGVRLRLEKAEPVDAAGCVPVLRLEGEFDIDTVPEIDRFLRRGLGPLYQRRSLVIDLRDVTLVDSTFIGFVVRLVGEARKGRGELVLAQPVGRVRSLLCTVGLPNLVPVYESLDEALNAVRGATAPLIPPAFSLAG
jgi:anti-sigma B factor antagonist